VDEGRFLMEVLHVTTRTHGRVLVRDTAGPSALVVGFHGYMESAAIQMERLTGIDGSDRWVLASVQGLHRFYRGRSDAVVASWMTRQDRELMIEDNIEYANEVLDRIAKPAVPIITVGFSQGVAMAFRAAVCARIRVAGVVAVGGDVPPELFARSDASFTPPLIVRGERDDWYTADKAKKDLAALRARSVDAEFVVHQGGHEWTADVAAAAAAFIERIVAHGSSR
jgi:predicted esterase